VLVVRPTVSSRCHHPPGPSWGCDSNRRHPHRRGLLCALSKPPWQFSSSLVLRYGSKAVVTSVGSDFNGGGWAVYRHRSRVLCYRLWNLWLVVAACLISELSKSVEICNFHDAWVAVIVPLVLMLLRLFVVVHCEESLLCSKESWCLFSFLGWACGQWICLCWRQFIRHKKKKTSLNFLSFTRRFLLQFDFVSRVRFARLCRCVFICKTFVFIPFLQYPSWVDYVVVGSGLPPQLLYFLFIYIYFLSLKKMWNRMHFHFLKMKKIGRFFLLNWWPRDETFEKVLVSSPISFLYSFYLKWTDALASLSKNIKRKKKI